MKIFAFWEPQHSIPGYISLCIKTWEKYLPDFTIELFDYKSLGTLLTNEEKALYTCKKLTLPKQSDAYRCALLLKYGGIWMDADTIITPAFQTDYYCKGECCCIGNTRTSFINGAYFYASHAETSFVHDWQVELIEHLQLYRKFLIWKPVIKLFNRARWKVVNGWDWCLNSIIDPLSKKYKEPELVIRDRSECRALPELIYSPDSSMDDRESYIRFWFSEGETPEKWLELEKNKGLIMLHNSWTPEEYKKMSEEEFLSSSCFLAVFLRKLLE